MGIKRPFHVVSHSYVWEWCDIRKCWVRTNETRIDRRSFRSEQAAKLFTTKFNKTEDQNQYAYYGIKG